MRIHCLLTHHTHTHENRIKQTCYMKLYVCIYLYYVYIFTAAMNGSKDNGCCLAPCVQLSDCFYGNVGFSRPASLMAMDGRWWMLIKNVPWKWHTVAVDGQSPRFSANQIDRRWIRWNAWSPKHTISKITIDNPSPHDRFTIGFATLIVSGN